MEMAMSQVAAIVCRFSSEETPLAEGATIFSFDVEEYAPKVNESLSSLGTQPLLMLNCAHMEPGWMEPMLSELAVTGGIVSPYFRSGEQARPWHEQVCPSAWMIRADVLLMLGGLNLDIMFGQAEVIAHRANEYCVATTKIPGAVCSPTFTPGQASRAGSLYYRQIEDANRVQQMVGGS